MMWNICFALMVLVLISSAAYARFVVRNYKSGRIITSFRAILAGVFVAVFIGLIPVFAVKLQNETGFITKLVMFDLLQTLQVFTINVGADLILDNISNAATVISGVYSVCMSVLFFVAPVLTFGFLASLLKSVFVSVSYQFHFRGDVYAFSELNAKSLTLAESIKAKQKKAVIVFTSVEKDCEFEEPAKELHAIIFREDIVSINFSKHSKSAQLTLFVVGEQEGDNLLRSISLIEKYSDRENTALYVFSTGAQGELLLSNVPEGKIRVRRINELRSVVYTFLYEEGVRLFETALPAKSGKKQINAVILGLGRYGTEVLKALAWYCQMDGYSVRIDAFDRDPGVEDRFSAMCPELMSEEYNGVSIAGESEYTIRIHSGTAFDTKSFADSLAALPETTFVFVCLGDDADNISQAANVRMLCERNGSKPIIKSVIYSADETAALADAVNFKGQSYGIEGFGDLKTTYSENILLGSDVERIALERHMRLGKEEDFWRYEYNYRSSIASAIHMKAREACGIPGADKETSALTEEERNIIETLEHKRWNAYMRSEGYIYSGSPDASSRNDLAKMHHSLVAFDALTEEDKRKDSIIGAK